MKIRLIGQTLQSRGAGTLGGMLAILLWSATVALVRSLTEQVGAITAGAAVHCVAGVASVAFILGSTKRIRHVKQLPPKYLLGCGALFVVYMLVLFLGVGLAKDRSQVLEVGLLNYLWPALTILLSLVLLKKRADWLLLPGTLLALAGVWLVLTQGAGISWQSFWSNVASNPAGYACGLTAAFTWALYSNLTRRWAGAERTGAVALFLPMSGLVLLLVSLAIEEQGSWNVRTFVEVGVFGVVTWLAYRLWDFAMRRGDVVLVAACSYLTPLLSTVVSCIYLNVSAEVTLWVGCVLIVVGSLVTWRSVSDQSTRKPSEIVDDVRGVVDS